MGAKRKIARTDRKRFKNENKQFKSEAAQRELDEAKAKLELEALKNSDEYKNAVEAEEKAKAEKKAANIQWIKDHKLLVGIIAVVFIIICIASGGSDDAATTTTTTTAAPTTAVTETSSVVPTVTREEYIQSVMQIMYDSYTDATVWYEEDGEDLHLYIKQNGIASGTYLASLGDADCLQAWKTITGSLRDISRNVTKGAESGGLSLKCSVFLVNDQDDSLVLYSAYNGATLTDCVKHNGLYD